MVSTVLSWVPIAEQVDRPQPSLISPYSASLLAFRSGFRLDKLSVWGRFPWLSVMIAISKMEVYKKVGEDYRCVLPPPCMLGSSIGKSGEIFFFCFWLLQQRLQLSFPTPGGTLAPVRRAF